MMTFAFERNAGPLAGVTQLVECDLAKVDVAGSNPVSRSKFQKESHRRLDSPTKQTAARLHGHHDGHPKRSLRPARAGQEPELYGGCRAVSGARHRSHNGHLQCGECGCAATLAICSIRPAGSRL